MALLVKATEKAGTVNSPINPLDFQAQALTLRAERQRVIASNIANADTPGYQARDFRFADALQSAAGTSRAASGLAATASGHLPGLSGGPGQPVLQYRQPEQMSLDGNTVDMDRERANFADNAVRYESTVRFINDQLRRVMSAITGQ
jgi:flagellar basal-body rod protein FlgB